MQFAETSLRGAYVIEIDTIKDERGFFARSWCKKEFTERSLNAELVQCNISYNEKKGTLRGMHYQLSPYEETKLVRCTRGSIFDVIVDLRPDSSTYLEWYGVILSETNHRMLYIPKGFAHGFQTLEDHAEVFYQMSDWYQPDAAAGLRWNDPRIGIEWPNTSERIISERDMNFGDYAYE